MTSFFSRVLFAKPILLLCLIVVSTAFSSWLIKKEDPGKKVFDYYLSQAGKVQETLKNLRYSIVQNASISDIRESFITSRLAYKKWAVISESFNYYQSRYLNSPALPRVEEDHPDEIILPHGYQMLEEKIFSRDAGNQTVHLTREIESMDSVVNAMKNETDFVYAFKNENIFTALRESCFRIVAMGITGFDSPVAKNSIVETKATLEGVLEILNLYKTYIEPKEWNNVTNSISGAITYLEQHRDFDSFNRLEFIKQFANPFTTNIIAIVEKHGWQNTTDRSPVNPFAKTLFDENLFNLAFFSPNERYQLSAARMTLGNALFFDPILSGNNTISCSSCHQSNKAFTDGLRTAKGIGQEVLTRNTPTLWNSVYQTRQFYDSRALTLENQFSEVVHNEKEMKGSLKNLVEALEHNEKYSELFRKAYPNEKTPITQFTISNAVAHYVRSLASLNSRFDLFMRGDETKMNGSEQNGFNLFAGKAKCATCHFIPLFNGLVPPQFTETESEVIGVPKTTNHKMVDEDLGKYNFTKSEIHKHSFKTPTLRNIELTAPYMHNGVFKSLEEVLNFYNKGGGKGLKTSPSNLTLPFDRLELSKKEKRDIIAFLKTLTDTSFSGNKVP